MYLFTASLWLEHPCARVSSITQWLTCRKTLIRLATLVIRKHYRRYKALAARARFVAVHYGPHRLKQNGSRCSTERPLGFAVWDLSSMFRGLWVFTSFTTFLVLSNYYKQSWRRARVETHVEAFVKILLFALLFASAQTSLISYNQDKVYSLIKILKTYRSW